MRSEDLANDLITFFSMIKWLAFGAGKSLIKSFIWRKEKHCLTGLWTVMNRHIKPIIVSQVERFSSIHNDFITQPLPHIPFILFMTTLKKKKITTRKTNFVFEDCILWDIRVSNVIPKNMYEFTMTHMENRYIIFKLFCF